MRAIAEAERPVRVLVDDHPAARKSRAPSLPLDLQHQSGEADGVVSGYYPLMLYRALPKVTDEETGEADRECR
jgi:hypothetical protein